jgi:PPK2 family polyphosphate:nucleotide phosphotransferase
VDSDLKQARSVRDALRARTGPVELAAIDPRSTPALPGKGSKAWSEEQVARLGLRIAGHQERLFASAKVGSDERRVLLVLQATDCGGKDGTVKTVVGTMNPQGVHVRSFGPPTRTELRHTIGGDKQRYDFLWRVERALPPAGYVGVFNRSHYEDVLVARVRSLASPEIIEERYRAIVDFEQRLVDTGTTLIKVMLHISHEEQRLRLLARLDDPTKHWKFNEADLDDRKLWYEYQRAYEIAIERTSTPAAPWYVVPADRKWYRNWAVANVVLAHLEDMKLTYPTVDLDVAALRRRLESDEPPIPPAAGKRKVNNR